MNFRFALGLFLVFLAASCSNDTMPKYSVIQGLRVLALTLDAPEVAFENLSTTTVNLTPTISDLFGAGRSLTYRLYYCLDPGVGLGAVPTCTGNPTLIALTSGTTLTAPNLEFKTPNYTGSLNPIAINLSGITGDPVISALYTAKFNSLPAASLYNGYSILIFFELFPTNDESAKITTFKRLIVSTSVKAAKNNNPSSLQFQKNSAALTVLPTTQESVDAHVPSSDFETYFIKDASGALQSAVETIETVWFLSGPSDIKCSKDKTCTTDGLFSLSRTVPGELNLFYPPSVSIPATRGRVLIGVAKDNRGGQVVSRLCDDRDSNGVCP
jgi:hypothetical protein